MSGDTALQLQSVGLGVTGLNHARNQLRERGIAFHDTLSAGSSAVEFDPDETFGARIVLLQAQPEFFVGRALRRRHMKNSG